MEELGGRSIIFNDNIKRTETCAKFVKVSTRFVGKSFMEFHWFEFLQK